MAITLAVRSDSINARKSIGAATPGLYYAPGTEPAKVVAGTATGLIGPSYIDHFQGTSLRRGLVYSGENLWGGQAFSILFRGARKGTGDHGMVYNGGPSQDFFPVVNWFRSANGNVYINMYNDRGQEMLGQTSTAVDAVLDTYHDWVLTCTGTTVANGLKIYKDNVLVLQSTLTNAATTTKDKYLSSICLGWAPGFTTGGFHTNELVIWDEVIDPNSVTLTSGTGALSGASRTAFVDAAAVAGHTDPGVSNVRLSTIYNYAGTAYTGTLDLPAVENVKKDVTYDNGTKTGTLSSTPQYLTVQQFLALK